MKNSMNYRIHKKCLTGILIVLLGSLLTSFAFTQQNILIQTNQSTQQQTSTNNIYPFPTNGINNTNPSSGYFVQTTQTVTNQPITTQSITTTPITTTPTVRIYLDKPVMSGSMAIYQPGERILVTAQLSSPGYLYIFNINSAGATTQLYPNEFDRDNLITNTQAITLPRNPQYAFTIEGPTGVDSVVAIASQRSLQGNQITFGDINNLRAQATRPASYWSSDLAQIQVGYGSFAAVQSPVISTQTVPNQTDMTQGTIYMTPLGSTGNTNNATVDLYSSDANTTTNTNSNTNTNTSSTNTQGYPSYCSTPGNQNRPECGGAGTTANTNTNTTANTNTTTTTTTPASSYPAYCNYAQYNSRSECVGAAITDGGTTSSNTASSGTTSSTTTSTSSYPAYCSTPANQSRSECGGAGTTNTNTAMTTTTASSYPTYCSYAQYNSRSECAGATITNSTANTTTTNTATSNTSSMPAYCSTPANQNRPECAGASSQTTQTTTQVASTQTTTTVPQYCSYAQYQNRPECGGMTSTSTTSTTATTATQTTGSSSYPAYCSTPANQYRTECGGSGSQSGSQSTTSNTTSNSYPTYCSSSQYQNRTECAGYASTYGTTTNTTVNTTTNTSSMPAYCSTPANQYRTECGGSGTPASTTNTGNSNTTSGYNQVAASSIYPSNTPIGVWQRLGAVNYSYLITRNCRCPEIYRKPLYVTVQNGAIITAIFTDNQSNASQEIIQSVPTLDELMQFALQFSQSNVAAVQAEYDVNYGFPTSIFLDSNVNAADDEVAYTISAFQLN